MLRPLCALNTCAGTCECFAELNTENLAPSLKLQNAFAEKEARSSNRNSEKTHLAGFDQSEGA